MICPFWQKPHCGTCSSIQACCTGCSVPSLASPSSVVISPLTAGRRRDARPNRRAVDDHRARPALAKSATKPRTLQAEIIAQDIEQRSRRVDIQGVRAAVHLQCYVAHSAMLLTSRLGWVKTRVAGRPKVIISCDIPVKLRAPEASRAMAGHQSGLFVLFASNDRGGGFATPVEENPIAGLAFVRDLRLDDTLRRSRRVSGIFDSGHSLGPS